MNANSIMLSQGYPQDNRPIAPVLLNSDTQSNSQLKIIRNETLNENGSHEREIVTEEQPDDILRSKNQDHTKLNTKQGLSEDEDTLSEQSVFELPTEIQPKSPPTSQSAQHKSIAEYNVSLSEWCIAIYNCIP